jgi:hypothetical protein
MLATAPARPAPPARARRPLARPASAAAPPSFPPYTLIARTPDYDLRLYAAHVVAVTPYARRDDGFARLGEYLAGANASATRFGDCQPVVMRYPWDKVRSGVG